MIADLVVGVGAVAGGAGLLVLSLVAFLPWLDH